MVAGNKVTGKKSQENTGKKVTGKKVTEKNHNFGIGNEVR